MYHTHVYFDCVFWLASSPVDLSEISTIEIHVRVGTPVANLSLMHARSISKEYMYIYIYNFHLWWTRATISRDDAREEGEMYSCVPCGKDFSQESQYKVSAAVYMAL